MISTLGQTVVLAALGLCAAGAAIGYVAGARQSSVGLGWTRRICYGFAVLMALATLLMEVALIRHDFSVSYVAKVGSTQSPLWISVVSLWSSLDGSILLWGLVLGLFAAAAAYRFSRHDVKQASYALATILAVGVFFSLLIAGPANPFLPTPAPVPAEGPGPNPLLQNHPLMIIHPPTLYLGYVGMTVPFAVAVAALLAGSLGRAWRQELRFWLLIPTGFLGLGIMLGGWWSYEVLGWGGYWAWDPVENASFLPWLTAVAAVHSALVLERRGTLKGWTVTLVLVTFLLTILGTFLTRSGVVNSVHSFTQSPIGPTFLVFLGIVLVASVILLSMRIDQLASAPPGESLMTREGAFLVNNLLLVVFMFTVLVGTLFPIAAEAVRGVKVSVGEPYFNRMAIPLGFGLLLLLGIGPALPWGRADGSATRRALLWPLPAAILGAALVWIFGGRTFPVLLTGFLAGFALWINVGQMLEPGRARARKGEGSLQGFRRAALRSPRILGAYTVHLGLIMTFVAIAISSTYQDDSEGRLRPGQSLELAGYNMVYESFSVEDEGHRVAQKARITVRHDDRELGTLEPALNQYRTRREPISSPAVRTSWGHDLYLTLMSVGADGTVGLRAILTPAVVWIWIGVFAMTVGTFLCLLPGIRPKGKGESAI